MKTALITGITGQDGTYLARMLLNKDYYVVGMSPRRSTANNWRLNEFKLLDNPNLELISGDLTCHASVSNVLSKYEYSEIYNLGAQSFVGESFNSPVSTFQINAVGVLNLLSAVASQQPNSRVYQASTSEMFGNRNNASKDLYYNEDTKLEPVSPYGIAKTAAHHLIAYYRKQYGLHASAGILFNHESSLRGLEFVTRKITDGVAQIVAGKKKTLELGNLDPRRDWGFARDYVEAMWLMLQQEEPDDYVIATGKAHSVQEFIEKAFNVVGLDWSKYVVTKNDFKRKSELHTLIGDPTKANEQLGWEAKIQLDDLIKIMLSADLRRHGLNDHNIK